MMSPQFFEVLKMAALILKGECHLELDLSKTDINCKYLQDKIWIKFFFYKLVSFSHG